MAADAVASWKAYVAAAAAADRGGYGDECALLVRRGLGDVVVAHFLESAEREFAAVHLPRLKALLENHGAASISRTLSTAAEKVGNKEGDDENEWSWVDEAVPRGVAELAAAVDDAGYGSGCGKEFAFALDVAASEFHREGAYHLSTEPEPLSAEQMTARYAELAKKFPITSIEDGLAEDDWAGWQHLTRSLDGVRLIGDDLLVTQTSRLRRAIDEGAADAILIKLNQVGTVSETLEACRLAADHGFRVVISHRSGETEDDFIADLAVATGCGWIKTGAPCRSERNAKYNRLLRIADQLGGDAGFGPLRW